MMSTDYLNNILKVYGSTFDIERNYELDNKNFSAYGYFNSKAEKYILVKEVNIWEASTFEHIFFLQVEKILEKDFQEIEELIKNKIEERFVRRGEKYPQKNHMSSCITVVFISSTSINEEIIKKIQKFKFTKNYLFSIRGYLVTKILGVDLEENQIYYNREAKDISNVYQNCL